MCYRVNGAKKDKCKEERGKKKSRLMYLERDLPQPPSLLYRELTSQCKSETWWDPPPSLLLNKLTIVTSTVTSAC